MNPYSKLLQKILIARPIRAAFLLLVICFSCSHRQPHTMDTVREKWYGKPIDAIFAKLKTPPEVTIHPDGEKQYVFHFSENHLYIDMLRGEPLDDMSTIRVQEEIARAEQSKCLLEIWVKNNSIFRINTSGQGCREIREMLGNE